jgi:hypothetical protein
LLTRGINTAGWLLVNNLLWGITTHAVNLTSTAYMMAARPLERIVGSYGMQIRGKLGGAGASAMRTQAIREYRYMTASILDSTRMAVRAFMEGDSIIAGARSSEAMRLTPRGAAWRQINFGPIKDASDLATVAMKSAYWSIGLPTRLLGTVDELTRQIRYRGMVMADASMEADKRGLKGEAYRQHIHRKLLDSFDDSGRGLDARAIEEAKVVNFQDELQPGTFGHDLQAFRARHPSAVLLFPFVRTPVNVLRYGVKLTPGLNMLQKRYRQAMKGEIGDEQQAHAMGQMALGTLFVTTAAIFADNGMITGSGPARYDARRNMLARGWKPNSFIFPKDDGGYDTAQFGRLDPIGLPLGMAADIYAMIGHLRASDGGASGVMSTVTDTITGVVVAMASQVRERTYLRNMAQFMDTMADPQRRGGGFIGQQAGNLVPFSSAFRNYGGEGMQYMREARNALDHVMATIPGFAEGVPLRYDALGEPIEINRWPFSTVSGDVVDQELIRMGMESPEGFTISRPSPNTGKGVDLRDITLEDGRNAYEALQVLSRQPRPDAPPLKDALATIIATPEYQAAIDGRVDTRGTKQNMLARAVRQYREAAMGQLRRESKVLQDALTEGDMKARGALEVLRSGTGGARGGATEQQREALRSMGDAFGIPMGTTGRR